MLLTEEQLRALESAKEEKEAYGEIETQHPGYLGAQDTFYVGTMKGVAGLPADVHRHLQSGGLCQVVHDEDADHGGGSAERSGAAVLR